MKITSTGISANSAEGAGGKKLINSELWHACAGPLISLPNVGSLVVYFPQGHSEQVATSMQKEADGIPSYPNLPSKLICMLHNVTLHADTETDEVYAQMTLQPIGKYDQEALLVPEIGVNHSKQPGEFFCKTLTASDTSTHGGFSVPRRAAEKIFPPLDFSMQPPAQEITAGDLHDQTWTFRHIYRGQPKRHLLTTGWSVFVSSKRLVAGDAVLFVRDEKLQLRLGIRRANKQLPVLSSSIISSDSMHIGILAAAAHAAANNSPFTIFYNPRTSHSEFVIPLSKYNKALYAQVSAGMRFRMMFESEESGLRRYMGTVTNICDLDPTRWKGSQWRNLQVGWDESTAGDRPSRVSIWEIEPVITPFYICPPPFFRNPCFPDDDLDVESSLRRGMPWIGDGFSFKDASSTSIFPGLSLVQWMSMQNQSGSGVEDHSKLLNFRSPSSAAVLKNNNSNLHQNLQVESSSMSPQLQQQILTSQQNLLQPQQSTLLPMTTGCMALASDQIANQNMHQAAVCSQVHQQQSLMGRSEVHQNDISTNRAALHGASVSQDLPLQQPPILQPSTRLQRFQEQLLQTQEGSLQVSHQRLQPKTQVQHISQQNLLEQQLQMQFVQKQQQVSLLNPIMDCHVVQKKQPQLHQQSQFFSLRPDQMNGISFSSTTLVRSPQPAIQQIPSNQNGTVLVPGQVGRNDGDAQESQGNLDVRIRHEVSNYKALEQPKYKFATTDHLEATSSGPSYSLYAGGGQQQFPLTGSDVHFKSHIQNFSTFPCTVGMDGLAPGTLVSRGYDSGKDNPDLLPNYSGTAKEIDTDMSSEIQSQSFGLPNIFFKPGYSNEMAVPNGGHRSDLTPRMRTYTKVQKRGSVGRTIDVNRYNGYEELKRDLASMFGIEGLLEDPQGTTEWKLVYVDHENDILLVGDDPWEEFMSCVQSIKILSSVEVQQMSLDAQLPPQNQGRSGNDSEFPWTGQYDDNSASSLNQ